MAELADVNANTVFTEEDLMPIDGRPGDYTLRYPPWAETILVSQDQWGARTASGRANWRGRGVPASGQLGLFPERGGSAVRVALGD